MVAKLESFLLERAPHAVGQPCIIMHASAYYVLSRTLVPSELVSSVLPSGNRITLYLLAGRRTFWNVRAYMVPWVVARTLRRLPLGISSAVMHTSNYDFKMPNISVAVAAAAAIRWSPRTACPGRRPTAARGRRERPQFWFVRVGDSSCGAILSPNGILQGSGLVEENGIRVAIALGGAHQRWHEQVRGGGRRRGGICALVVLPRIRSEPCCSHFCCAAALLLRRPRLLCHATG